MPSSDIEIIEPANGRGETRNFLITCLVVLITASSLLALSYHTTATTLSALPTSLSNLATQISNAVEEIQLLEEAGLIEPPYQLETLPLPSHQNTSFVQKDDHCFILHQDHIIFAIERHPEHWDAHWAQSTEETDCHAAIDWHDLNQ